MSVTVAISENPPITVPARATASLASFREWARDNDLPEKTKLLYCRGEVMIDMGTEQIFSHVEVKTEITTVLRVIAKEGKLGRMWAEGFLVTNKDAELSCNPDAVFVSNEAFSSKRVKLVEGKEGGFVELLGSPDMVLEVVSDSSEKKDNQTLFEAYYEAGISEYWLVDARGEEIEFNIYKHGSKKYTVVKKQPGGWVKSAVFGKSFRRTRGKDATGNPEFTLEVK
ncbi:MAG: Uma2 family endonuclease [Planctomycetia bacterium]|nr:Uma2 family endonuclease [Planctomycetia bacterium]